MDLSVLLKAAAEKVGCEAIALYLNQPELGVAERVAFLGEEPRASVPFGVTPLGECAETGVGFHRETKGTKAFKYHSHLYLPLLSPEGATLGVVAFSAVKPDFFADSALVTKAQECSQSLTLACLSVPNGP